jgi:dCTP deaminase
MYLSDRDLQAAIASKALIFEPAPDRIDPTSIDLHLGPLAEAKIWDIESFAEHEASAGRARPELRVGRYKLVSFSRYLMDPPPHREGGDDLVCRRGNEVIVRTGGFLLWPTREVVGTPLDNAQFIAFVDGKSTKARAGIVVHLTAPTIHAAWAGNITLEIANFGPFDLVLQEGDVIAQITVAKVTSPPSRTLGSNSITHGQTGADGMP